MIDLRSPEERAGAAGEYVLGSLGDEDRAVVDAALPHDPALQAEVYAWQDRLLALSATVAPQAPGAQLWQRIDVAVTAQAAAAPRAVEPTTTGPPPWWQRLSWWQGLSGLTAMAALVMAVLLVQQPATPEGPRYVALLQSPDGQSTGWVVELQADRLRLVPVADGGAPPTGRTLQFWTKPMGAAGPTSLGLVQAGQTAELPLSRLPAVEAQQLFEITLEPEGGSPIGRPTGPVLFVGRTVAL